MSAALVAAFLVVSLTLPAPVNDSGDVYFVAPAVIGMLAFAGIGALITSRTRNPIGWIFLAVAALFSAAFLAVPQPLSRETDAHDRMAPAAAVSQDESTGATAVRFTTAEVSRARPWLLASTIGIDPITVVPVPGSERTSSSPPSAAKRSAILVCPAPRGVRAASNPRPSSATSNTSASLVPPSEIMTLSARAYFATFWRASRQQK